ncbi:MAG: ferrous iron transport protein A [Crocinitomicaceae bacterium]|nr:ferrous iron transport protein A [Crocinitomicaceae bacterium]
MKKEKNCLSLYAPGEACTVHSLNAGELAPKMAEMGLYTGKNLRVLFRAPFGGPMAIDLDGYVLSLRLDEASMVVVKPIV